MSATRILSTSALVRSFSENVDVPRLVEMEDGTFIAMTRDTLENLSGDTGIETDRLVLREIPNPTSSPICLLEEEGYAQLLDHIQVVATGLGGTDLLEGY